MIQEAPPARFVGRESELTQLHAWLEKARHGERQLIFVTGEAGIGKTTLVETFLEQLAASGTVWLGHGQCVEHYGQGEAYLPLLEAFGRLGREPGGEQLVTILSRYAPTWLVQMPALLEAGELHTLQQKIVGATQGRMLREMAEALEALTAVQPLVLCVEDLHWSDYSSLELLAYLARRLGPSRLMVVGTYRPVDVILRDHPLKDLKQDLLLHGYCEELRLEFLSQTAVRQYLDQRFVGSLFADRLAPEIHRRTEGNPLFMVNVIDDLIRQEVIVQQAEGWAAGEVADIQLPSGIQRFLEQQTEQTDPDVQLMLEAASIAGMDFSASTIANVLGESVETVERQCETLVRREQFLCRSAEQATNGTASADYRFRHALYQETFYNRVPAGRRARLHQRMGESLEQAFSARTGQIAVELALHFEHGGDYPKAMQYLWQAGETSMRRYAPQEAVRHYSKSLELLALTPDTPERAQQELMFLITVGAPMITAKSAIAPEVEQTYARARELCQQMGEAPQLFPALAGLYRFHVIRGEHAVAQELALQLLHLAESVQDPTFFISADVALGYVLFLQGKFGEAQEHLERSRALYDPVQHSFLAFMYGDDPGIMASAFSAWTLWFRGYADQALTRSQEALGLATELAHPHVLSSIHGLNAQLHRFRREGKQSLEQADASVALSAEQGGDIWIAIGTMFRGWALTQKGQGEEGIAQMQQGLAAYQETGAAAELPHYLSLLAEAYGKIGRPEEGLTVLEEVFVGVEESGERFFEAELYRLKGELLLGQKSKGQRAKGKGQRAKGKGQGAGREEEKWLSARKKLRRIFSGRLRLCASRRPSRSNYEPR